MGNERESSDVLVKLEEIDDENEDEAGTDEDMDDVFAAEVVDAAVEDDVFEGDFVDVIGDDDVDFEGVDARRRDDVETIVKFPVSQNMCEPATKKLNTPSPRNNR